MRLSQFVQLGTIFFSTLVFTSSVFADLELGAGTSTFTAGRFVPALELTYAGKDQAFAWSATGVRNSYYYQSSHLVAYYRTWNAGTMWGGAMNAGFGGAIGYSARSFKDEGSVIEDKATDFLVGPAIRMNWSYGFFYLNLAVTFGLRDLSKHITGLTFQDVESMSLGVRF